MSEEIIKVLDYIGEKVGIAIDWTSEAVVPQITEIISRYTKFNIASHIAGIALCLALFIVAIVFIVKIIKAYDNINKTNEDNFWFYNWMGSTEISDITICMIAIVCIVIIISAVFVCINIHELLKWIFIPELNIIKELQSYLAA